MAEIQPDERDGIEECKVSSEVSVENTDSDLKLHYDGDMQTTIEFDRWKGTNWRAKKIQIL